jgi:uncharacterized surface protein with fasciclin (FAS1) repeats
MKLAKKLLCSVVTLGLMLGVGVAIAQDGGGDKPAAKPKMQATKSILEQLVGPEASAPNGKYTTLVELVKVAGLEETLKGKGPMVLFAPVDEAFAAMPKEKPEALKKDAAGAKALVENLLVAQEFDPKGNTAEGAKVKTVGGAELTVKRVERVSTVNDAKMVRGASPVPATNGRIIGIDKVLMAEPAGK